MSALAAFAILLQAFGPLLPMSAVRSTERDRTLAFVLSLSPHALCLSGGEEPAKDPTHPANHSNKCGLCYSLHLIGPALLAAAIFTVLLPPRTVAAVPRQFDAGYRAIRAAACRPRAPPIPA
jgi:hypothetical protein